MQIISVNAERDPTNIKTNVYAIRITLKLDSNVFAPNHFKYHKTSVNATEGMYKINSAIRVICYAVIARARDLIALNTLGYFL